MAKRTSSNVSLGELFRPKKGRKTSRELSEERLDILRREIENDDHLIPLSELYERLGTDPVVGLTSDDASGLLRYYGPNKLTPSTQDSAMRVLIRSMCSGFSPLIWFGAFLCLVSYAFEAVTTCDATRDNLFLGIVLICVDIICGLFTFYQEYKSSKIMESFNDMLPDYATCIRDGEIFSNILVRDLVKGDIVEVKAGDALPADIRIIESRGFKVDNSSLTGENAAVSRFNTEGTPTSILESKNLAFFSTNCVEGWAKGVVIACGDITALGRVAGLAARLHPAPSPLSREVASFTHAVAVWALTLGVFVAITSVALGYSTIETVIFVIGIIVANVPEGLQPTVTASLTMTASRMASRRCLVKSLAAVETLGCTSVICSDKTGTLTENRMSVVGVLFAKNKYDVQQWDAQDESFEFLEDPTFIRLSLCGMLCSRAEIVVEPASHDSKRNVTSGRTPARASATAVVRGDASEAAILKFLRSVVGGVNNARQRFPKVAEIPFSSLNKYQLSIHLDVTSGKHVLMMKGAPETILARCSNVMLGRDTLPLDANHMRYVEDVCLQFAKRGERVLAFADRTLGDPYKINYEFNVDEPNFPEDGLRFLGLMSLMDPPRKEVHAAVKICRSAGIRVFMVTGDHPATARAIAEAVGIASDDYCRVITGQELREISSEQLDDEIAEHHEIVFARTSPVQKLQIVEACQRLHHVVAVTGDGVNDSPALKQADIGIAMGITGSQVAKQTADIILLDDNFATIIVGIEEGRRIFDNLKKCICYIISSNVPEVLPVLIFITFSIPLPIGVVAILLVDLGTDMWPAISLAYERAESDVLSRAPRDVRHERLADAQLLRTAVRLGALEAAAGMFAYFVVMAEHGFYPSTLLGIRKKWDSRYVNDLRDSFGQEWTHDERMSLEFRCHTAYFVSIVLAQVANVLLCRTRYNSTFRHGLNNHVLVMGIVLELIIACLVTYTPPLHRILNTNSLVFRWWLLPLPFMIMMLALEEGRKYLVRSEKLLGWL